MKILLLGKNGQLGWEARRALAGLGEVVALDWPEIDFTHPESLRGLVTEVKPQVIFNAAAYTAVDKAESERETARLINSVAPGVLAEEALKTGAVIVHISTDYVFDGMKGKAYLETDAPHPLSAYAQTKLDGDLAVQQVGGAWLIFRTSWVYSTRRDSFVSKVLEWSRKNPVLRVVDDQIAGPTWARALAEVISLVLARAGVDPAGWVGERHGIYHLAGSGWCSRLEWAREILKHDPQPDLRVSNQLLPAKTEDFPAQARRPLFSALDCKKFEQTFNLMLPGWKVALDMAMEK